MAFIFSTSHLPETRVRRPDHLEDEEDDDVMQPMPRVGGVRAFSHLPVRDNPAPSTGPLREDSPRGGTVPIPPRSATSNSPSRSQPEAQDDAPPPEADTDPEDAPAPQDHADDRPWYMPRITAQDLPPQDHPEDAHAPTPKPWENTARSSRFDAATPADRSTSSTRDNGFSPSPQDLRDAFHSPAPRSPVGQAPAQDNRPALPGGRLFEQRSAPEAFLRQQMGKGASGTTSQQRPQGSERTLAARQQPVRGSNPPANGSNPAAPSQPVSPYQGPAPDKMDEGRGASPRNNSEVKETPAPLPPRNPDALPQSSDKAVKASSSSSEGCGSKGDLYDIPDATFHSVTAAEIFEKNQDEGGLAITFLGGSRGKIKAKERVEKDANGKYVGYVCIPSIYTYSPVSYISRPQLRWTSGKPGADTADITAKTVADLTEHEKAHIKVDQSVGRRISKYYLENVFKIKTRPYATEEEAKKKVLNMELMFFLQCNSAFTKMRETYNNKHLPANIRAYKGGSGTEWYEPNPDWFTSQGLDDKIQNEPVNVPLPTDR